MKTILLLPLFLPLCLFSQQFPFHVSAEPHGKGHWNVHYLESGQDAFLLTLSQLAARIREMPEQDMDPDLVLARYDRLKAVYIKRMTQLALCSTSNAGGGIQELAGELMDETEESYQQLLGDKLIKKRVEQAGRLVQQRNNPAPRPRPKVTWQFAP